MRTSNTIKKSPSRQIQILLILLMPLVLATACEQYPRDPRESLKQIEQSGMLHVGVMTNPPWIIDNASDSPGGVEARLIERFAQELGVEVIWHWGSAENLYEGLSRYELDILLGGITASNPWQRQAGFTVPYLSGHVVVGVPQTQASLSSLDGVTVATRQGEGLSEQIENKGGRVQFLEELAGADMAVAAPDWEIDTSGMKNTGITLRQFQHVLAVPKGENALLMRLEDFLLANADRQTVTSLIATETAQ